MEKWIVRRFREIVARLKTIDDFIQIEREVHKERHKRKKKES